MKKLLALVLAGVMAFSLVACGGGSEGGDGDADAKLKVNLLCTSLGDKSFNDSADAGLKRMANAGLIDYTPTEYGQDNLKVPSYMEEAAEDYDVVVCNNLGFGEATKWLKDNAAKYPETTFIIYDEPTEKMPEAKNVQMLAYKANESDFIAGALAGLMSKTGVIGFLGGVQSPVISVFLVGYIEGDKYFNEDIRVIVSYVGNYTDTTTAANLAKTAINDGADVLHAVAGGAGNGYLSEAQVNGKLGIGVDSDQYESFKEAQPDLAKSIVTSSLKDVGASLEVVIGDMLDGTYEWSECLWFGMAENCAGIAENENYKALVSADIDAQIQDIKAKLADGTITVSTAYGMDEATEQAIIDSVK